MQLSDKLRPTHMHRDRLPEVLRRYIDQHGLTQTELAKKLGYSQGQVSKLISGERKIATVDDRRRIARTLGVPPQELGVLREEAQGLLGGSDDATILLAEPLIQAAEELREAGQAEKALGHLEPVLELLGPRRSQLDRSGLYVLGRGYMLRGTFLGDVLPKRFASRAVDEIEKAHEVAEELGVQDFLADALHRLGNEQRKAGRLNEALAAISRADELVRDPAQRARVLIHLARVQGEMRKQSEFGRSVNKLRGLLEDSDARSATAHPFIADEVELRGRLRIGSGWYEQMKRVESTVEEPPPAGVAPQWIVIADITNATLLLRRGDVETAASVVLRAAEQAETMGMTQQMQRMEALLADYPASALDDARLTVRKYLMAAQRQRD